MPIWGVNHLLPTFTTAAKKNATTAPLLLLLYCADIVLILRSRILILTFTCPLGYPSPYADFTLKQKQSVCIHVYH